MKLILVSCFTLLLSTISLAQVNADSLFTEAKALAAAGEFERARELMLPALEAYPDYHDIRVFIGRTYAWENNEQEAIPYFQETLQRDSTNVDAWIALGDVRNWSGDYHTTVEEMTKAESSLKNDSAGLNEVKVRKASALFELREYRDALTALEGTAGPKSERIRQNTLLRLVNHSVDVYGSAEFFSAEYDNMYYGTVQVGQSTKYGMAIARINTAHRFGENGFQGEIDLYPRITNDIYGYVNYGYSQNTTVFPNHRVGGELYTAIGKRFEVSLGMRYLYFNSASTVTMYTGSVGCYYKKYWFNIRPFITPQEDGVDVSTSLLARRYLKESRSWITLRGSFGFSPDARRIQVGQGEQIQILQTYLVGAEWQQTLSQNWMFILGFNYTKQELAFSPGDFVNIYTPSLGIKRLL